MKDASPDGDFHHGLEEIHSCCKVERRRSDAGKPRFNFVFGRCGKRATRPCYKTEICLKLYGSELMIFRYSASLNAFKVWVVTFPSELTDSMNFAQTSSLGNSAMITAS